MRLRGLWSGLLRVLEGRLEEAPPELEDVVRRLWRDAGMRGRLEVKVSGRAVAYYRRLPDRHLIVVGRRLLRLDEEVREAVILHEVGHAAAGSWEARKKGIAAVLAAGAIALLLALSNTHPAAWLAALFSGIMAFDVLVEAPADHHAISRVGVRRWLRAMVSVSAASAAIILPIRLLSLTIYKGVIRRARA